MIRTLFSFLGGITFALVLIALTAGGVIVGTLVESLTDSHRHAAFWTYHNPLFKALLWLFFINILFAALRRWPFRRKHIPFLLTHLGLLMILGGSLAKAQWGVQGSMNILEGGVSNALLIDDSYILHVEKRDVDGSLHYAEYPLHKTSWGHFVCGPLPGQEEIPLLEVHCLHVTPHSHEQRELWIKGNVAQIAGLPPFPAHNMDELDEATPCPLSLQSPLPWSDDTRPWHYYALRGSKGATYSREIWIQGTMLHLSIAESVQSSSVIPLERALKGWMPFPGGQLKASIQWEYSSLEGLQEAQLLLDVELDAFGSYERLAFPLLSSEPPQNLSHPHLGLPPLLVDLRRPPTLLLLKDEYEEERLFTFHEDGKIRSEVFGKQHPLVAFDSGFAGYGTFAHLPHWETTSQSERRKNQLQALRVQLQEHMNPEKASLLPFLELLRQASEKEGGDFVDNWLAFLQDWDHSHQWLYPSTRPLSPTLHALFAAYDWDALPLEWRKGSALVAHLFDSLDTTVLTNPQRLPHTLLEMGWPLQDSLQDYCDAEGNCPLEKLPAFFSDLTHQLFALSYYLPEENAALSPQKKAQLFSALLRAEGLHLNALLPKEEKEEETFELLTPIRPVRRPLPPKDKWEDNLPLAHFLLRDGESEERVALTYDRYGTGLKWPALQGRYRLRFQPLYKTIPYRVRLRNTQQISYPGSQQAYSYESQLLLSDGTTTVPTTISMNNVHQTWDGYRFYMASIYPPQPTQAQRAQIVVNHDPTKSFLTYPGGILLSLGIFLLFWLKPYGKRMMGLRI